MEKEMKKHILQRAECQYNKILMENKKQEETLNSKKFPLNTIIVYKNNGHFDSVFNVGEIGKIVGWDFENEYYRIYFSEYNSYIGAREEKIEKYHGDEKNVPKDILYKKALSIDYLGFYI